MDPERRAFALRHLYVYPRLKLAYTYIPKNACASFKRTFGIAQGWLSPESKSAHTMKRGWWLSGLAQYTRSEERIVVVRDPFDRALSAYLNKFLLRQDPIADHAMETGLAEALGPGATRDDVSFADFVAYLAQTPSSVLDEHWRPQSDFLTGCYTRLVRFEHLDQDTAFLAERGLVLDAVRGHSTTKMQQDLGPGWGDRTAGRLRNLRHRRGVLPTRENMFDERLRGMILDRFADDVDLFNRVGRASEERTGGL